MRKMATPVAENTTLWTSSGHFHDIKRIIIKKFILSERIQHIRLLHIISQIDVFCLPVNGLQLALCNKIGQKISHLIFSFAQKSSCSEMSRHTNNSTGII